MFSVPVYRPFDLNLYQHKLLSQISFDFKLSLCDVAYVRRAVLRQLLMPDNFFVCSGWFQRHEENLMDI